MGSLRDLDFGATPYHPIYGEECEVLLAGRWWRVRFVGGAGLARFASAEAGFPQRGEVVDMRPVHS